LGKVAFGNYGLVFPLIVPMLGVVTAVIGIFAVTPRRGDRSGMSAINRAFFISAITPLILVVGAAFLYLPDSYSKLTGVTDRGILTHGGNPQWLAIGAVIIGLVLASAIQLLTGYFTETDRKPVREIGESSLTGPATVILPGVATGLESGVYAALLLGGRGLPGGHRQRDARPVRGGTGRYRPSHHGRRHRIHGLLRPGDRQRPGHRGDVRGRRR